MKSKALYLIGLLHLFFVQSLSSQTLKTAYRAEVSQYGITWRFNKPSKTGQFITGDWWVIGPVIIVNITPVPGPVHAEKLEIKVNRWNDTRLKPDNFQKSYPRSPNFRGFSS